MSFEKDITNIKKLIEGAKEHSSRIYTDDKIHVITVNNFVDAVKYSEGTNWDIKNEATFRKHFDNGDMIYVVLVKGEDDWTAEKHIDKYVAIVPAIWGRYPKPEMVLIDKSGRKVDPAEVKHLFPDGGVSSDEL